MKKENLLFFALFLIASAQTVSATPALTNPNYNDTLPPTTIDSDTALIYTEVDKEPLFIGEGKAWAKFLQKNLNAVVPVNNGAPTGTYTVIIEFLVEKDGTTKDYKALTQVGYGMEEECLRIIKLSGKWQPALRHGQPVRFYRKQPITFVISEG